MPKTKISTTRTEAHRHQRTPRALRSSRETMTSLAAASPSLPACALELWFLLSFPSAHEVPAIASDVEKNGDLAVGFFARLAHEFHAGGDETFVTGVEVVDAQEESDAAGVLFADDGGLRLTIGARQKQSC